MKIPFTKPFVTGKEIINIRNSLDGRLSGDGPFTERAQFLIQEQLNCGKVLLTTSCTHALEMAAILLDLAEGDEVIVPSYTFVSSALAFVMHGARIVFSDVDKNTLNISADIIKALITKKTKAIVVVHYAGVACDMDAIMEIAEQSSIVVIEDNAHGIYGKYKNINLGSIGHLATLSFHETKNITCGEGGALIVNDEKYYQRAEIIREKGTDRSKFFRGEVDKYTWVDKGSSYLISDILAAFLCGQLEQYESIQRRRKKIWDYYRSELSKWATENNVVMQQIPKYATQSYHMFYFLLQTSEHRDEFISYLKGNGITATFHYQPLHSAKFLNSKNEISYNCPVSERISSIIVRLPMYGDLSDLEMEMIVSNIKKFTCINSVKKSKC